MLGRQRRGLVPAWLSQEMHQNTAYSVCDTLLMLKGGEETYKCGTKQPQWEQGRSWSWPLLGGEDRVATEGTRDEQLPVLLGRCRSTSTWRETWSVTRPCLQQRTENENQRQHSHIQYLPASIRLPSQQQLQVLSGLTVLRPA